MPRPAFRRSRVSDRIELSHGDGFLKKTHLLLGKIEIPIGGFRLGNAQHELAAILLKRDVRFQRRQTDAASSP